MSSRRKTLLASLLALCWLAAMLAAFWWFQVRYIRPFEPRTELFSGSQLRLPDELAGPGPIRLVHFWDPACPCNVGNQQHLGELVARFAAQGVQFYSVRKAGSQGQLPDSLQALRPLAGLAGSEGLPASPAVAIWDREGRLAYFGPYSEGALCTSGNSFIEPILEALAAGRRVRAESNLAVGCFCDWRAD
jgi:hypothetical protein